MTECEFYDIKETAAALKVSTRTVATYIRNHELTAYKPHRKLLFKKSDVIAFATNRLAPASAAVVDAGADKKG